MSEVLKMQENDANNAFVKYITCNYQSWLDPDAPAPVLGGLEHRGMTSLPVVLS